jgi:hypothetical protein
MKLDIDTSMANNIAVFTGEVKREPVIAQANVDGEITNVMNFDLVLKYKIRITSGEEVTNYVKCSAWGDDSISSVGAAVARAFQQQTKIVVVGAVVPSVFTFKMGAGRTIGIFKVSALNVVEVTSGGGKASAKPNAGEKAKVVTTKKAEPVKGKAITKAKAKAKKPRAGHK